MNTFEKGLGLLRENKTRDGNFLQIALTDSVYTLLEPHNSHSVFYNFEVP